MKRTLAAAVAIVSVLLLAGCSAPATDAGAPNAVASSSPEPLVASPTPSEAISAGGPEGAYLDAVHQARNGDVLSSKTQIPDATDEQLIVAGYAACEKIAAGEQIELITVVDGEQTDSAGYFLDSFAIASAASKTLCA